jgi:hypothetical protein
MGPLMTLADYDIVDKDILYIEETGDQPSFFHDNSSCGILLAPKFSIPLSAHTNKMDYGEKLATRHAFDQPIMSALEMKKNRSSIFWKFSKYGRRYSIRSDNNIADKICLYSWTTRSRGQSQGHDNKEQKCSLNAIHKPEVSLFKGRETVELQLEYDPSIWEPNKLYALCINTSLHKQFHQSLVKHLQTWMPEIGKFPKELTNLICDYVHPGEEKDSTIKFVDSLDGLDRQNSEKKLEDCYCGYFTFS